MDWTQPPELTDVFLANVWNETRDMESTKDHINSYFGSHYIQHSELLN